MVVSTQRWPTRVCARTAWGADTAPSFAARAALGSDWNAGIAFAKSERERLWPPRDASLSAEANPAWAKWGRAWRVRDAITAAFDVLECAHWAAGYHRMASAPSEAWDTAASAGRDEHRWQVDRLLAWLGDEEPEPWPLPTHQAVAA